MATSAEASPSRVSSELPTRKGPSTTKLILFKITHSTISNTKHGLSFRVDPLCSADGSTHTESNKLTRKVKHRARPNLSLSGVKHGSLLGRHGHYRRGVSLSCVFSTRKLILQLNSVSNTSHGLTLSGVQHRYVSRDNGHCRRGISLSCVFGALFAKGAAGRVRRTTHEVGGGGGGAAGRSGRGS